jgi:predicted HicB family RNase H-like nuclease
MVPRDRAVPPDSKALDFTFRKCKQCKHLGLALDLLASFGRPRGHGDRELEDSLHEWKHWKEPIMSELLLHSASAPLSNGEMETKETPFQGDPRAEVMRVAVEWYNRKPDWVTFFREILGVNGVVRKLFANGDQIAEFEQTDQYAELQQMVAKLREQPAPPDDKEPTRVITVRMPKSLHESLRDEAQDKRTSMNQLCISKLLQVIDNELIPTE